MSEQPETNVIPLRPALNLMYDRQRRQTVAMVTEMGVAETILTLAAVGRERDVHSALLYDEHAAIRERAWVDGVYDGLTLLGTQMEEKEDAG